MFYLSVFGTSLCLIFSGSCIPCPNEMMPIGSRQFKTGVGLSCSPCSVCGGEDQNGTQYEKSQCTTTKDVVCTLCEPCSTGIRLGCAGQSAGTCVNLPKEMNFCSSAQPSSGSDKPWALQCTSTVFGTIKTLAPGKYITESPSSLSLTGICSGNGLFISPNTIFETSNSIADFTLSALNCDANSSDLVIQNSSHNIQLSGDQIVYFGLTDVRFSSSVNLSVSYNYSQNRRRLLDSQTISHSFICWDRGTGTWIVMPGKSISSADSPVLTSSVQILSLNFSICGFASIELRSNVMADNGVSTISLAIIIPVIMASSFVILGICVLICRVKSRAVIKTQLSKRAIESQHLHAKKVNAITNQLDGNDASCQTNLHSLTSSHHVDAGFGLVSHTLSDSNEHDVLNTPTRTPARQQSSSSILQDNGPEFDSPHCFVSTPDPKHRHSMSLDAARAEKFDYSRLQFPLSAVGITNARRRKNSRLDSMSSSSHLDRYHSVIAPEGYENVPNSRRRSSSSQSTQCTIGQQKRYEIEQRHEIQRAARMYSTHNSQETIFPTFHDNPSTVTGSILSNSTSRAFGRSIITTENDQMNLMARPMWGGPAGNPSEPNSNADSLVAETSYASTDCPIDTSYSDVATRDFLPLSHPDRYNSKAFESQQANSLPSISAVLMSKPRLAKSFNVELLESTKESPSALVLEQQRAGQVQHKDALQTQGQTEFYPGDPFESRGVHASFQENNTRNSMYKAGEKPKNQDLGQFWGRKNQGSQRFSLQSDTIPTVSDWSSASSLPSGEPSTHCPVLHTEGNKTFQKTFQNPFYLKPFDKAGNSLCADVPYSMTEHSSHSRTTDGQSDVRPRDLNIGPNDYQYDEGNQVNSTNLENVFHPDGHFFDEYADETDISNAMINVADDFASTTPGWWQFERMKDPQKDDGKEESTSFQQTFDAPETLFAALEQEAKPSNRGADIYDSYTLLDLPSASADSSGLGATDNDEDDLNAIISLRPQTRLFLRSGAVEGSKGAVTPRQTVIRGSANLSPLDRKASSLSPTLVAEMPSSPNMRASGNGCLMQLEIPQDNNDFSFSGFRESERL